MVRSRGSGLLGRTAQTVARTAVIAGTATAVSGAVARRHARGAAPAATPEADSTVPSGLSADAMDQLKKLADLRDQGVLTEEEFAAQKARILS
jgi:hypothetical protein